MQQLQLQRLLQVTPQRLAHRTIASVQAKQCCNHCISTCVKLRQLQTLQRQTVNGTESSCKSPLALHMTQHGQHRCFSSSAHLAQRLSVASLDQKSKSFTSSNISSIAPSTIRTFSTKSKSKSKSKSKPSSPVVVPYRRLVSHLMIPADTFQIPNEAGAASDSAALLLRGGFIRQSSKGLYTLLPLALRVIQRMTRIIEQELNAVPYTQQIDMPLLQPQGEFSATDALTDSHQEMYKFKDRRQQPFILSPTCESQIAQLMTANNLSYRDLPIRLFQIGKKFRDESIPRGGLLRTREFLMADAYSFDVSSDRAMETYAEMSTAFERIFKQMGLYPLPLRVEAFGGEIGEEQTSHEFHILAPKGKDTLLLCDECGYIANQEKATSFLPESVESRLRDKQHKERPEELHIVRQQTAIRHALQHSKQQHQQQQQQELSSNAMTTANNNKKRKHQKQTNATTDDNVSAATAVATEQAPPPGLTSKPAASTGFSNFTDIILRAYIESITPIGVRSNDEQHKSYHVLICDDKPQEFVLLILPYNTRPNLAAVKTHLGAVRVVETDLAQARQLLLACVPQKLLDQLHNNLHKSNSIASLHSATRPRLTQRVHRTPFVLVDDALVPPNVNIDILPTELALQHEYEDLRQQEKECRNPLEQSEELQQMMSMSNHADILSQPDIESTQEEADRKRRAIDAAINSPQGKKHYEQWKQRLGPQSVRIGNNAATRHATEKALMQQPKVDEMGRTDTGAVLSDRAFFAQKRAKLIQRMQEPIYCEHPQQGQFRLAQAGDACAHGDCVSGTLHSRQGIEVAHIFYLSQFYSRTPNCQLTFETANSHHSGKAKSRHVEMCSFGIGVTRLLAAVVEASHDAFGCVWPVPLAPFQVVILPIMPPANKKAQQTESAETLASPEALEGEPHAHYLAAEELYDSLEREPNLAGQVLLDDRLSPAPGARMRLAQLIGVPFIVYLGKSFQRDGQVEIECRRLGSREGDKIYCRPDEVARTIQSMQETSRAPVAIFSPQGEPLSAADQRQAKDKHTPLAHIQSA